MSGIVFGKLALVTGAGSGIGRAVCQILSKEGAIVIAADRDFTACQETIKNYLQDSKEKHSALSLNVKNKENILSTVKDVLKIYKRLPNVIVNSAGITRDNWMIKLSEEDFDDVINVNLKGTFLVSQAYAQALIESGLQGASIINVASIIGKTGNIGQTSYAASKAGVEGMTRSAAKELGKFNIRVNAVLPGFIETPMIATVPDKVKESIVKHTPLKRMGKPEEIAEVITFLASDRSSFITGASIEVTGGFSN